MIEFELDIPSLTSNGILMRGPFGNTEELSCTSKIDQCDEQ